jgi:hypothetical protein
MSSPADSHEKTILESKGILIHDQIFHAVLTDRRIILTRYSDNKLSIRSIYLADIQKIEQDTDDDGDPVIIVVTPSATGEIKKAVLLFSPENFPDPHKESSLWASEINSLIQPAVPFSQSEIPKKDPSTPVLCGTCGNSVTDGSVFCNLCGTKIMNAVQQNPPEQREERVQDAIIAPEISSGEREPAPEPVPEKISILDGDDSGTGENFPVIEPLLKEQEKKESFFTQSGSRKPVVIAISALVVIIVVIAAIFVVLSSGSQGFGLTSIGMNGTTPEVKEVASTTNPMVPVTTSPITTRTPATPLQTTTPAQTSTSQVVVVQPSFTTVPEDPYSVFVSYPSLFNTGNAAGIYALLSENMKSHYPLDTLKNELATARSNGCSMMTVQVKNQIIEEDSAILEMDISWNCSGFSVISLPRVYLVNETNQWKLDSLVVGPLS